MGTGYIRQSLADIQDGEDIIAEPLNREFNSLQTAFDSVTGHSHDGTLGEGPKINLSASVTGTLATGSIADGAVTTVKIADSNVTNAKIADNAVTTSKITDLNVTTNKIADGNITTIKILDANVTTPKVANDAITTPKIADGNVTTAKILDSNITTAKIADSNITTAKVADNNVTNAKLADVATATIKGRITAGTGDPEDLNATQGRTVLGLGSIATLNSVATANIDNLAVTTAKIADGAVTTIKIADSNVTTAKITDANVTNAKLANMGANTIKGAISSGAPVDLTATQGRTVLGLGTAALVNTGTSTGNVPTIAQADTRYAIVNDAAAANPVFKTGLLDFWAAATNAAIRLYDDLGVQKATLQWGRVLNRLRFFHQDQLSTPLSHDGADGIWRIAENPVHHDGIAGRCRAYINFNGTGTVAIRKSFNVASIVDNGVGDYTINFTTPMPDTNYIVVGSGVRDIGAQPLSVHPLLTTGFSVKTINAVRIVTSDTDTAAFFDGFDINIAIYG